ncbi:MAG TPA: metal ABC transporter permease, partial [Gemmatimonadales bacterium]|nr:metal ABC transporter permease [Gemmatimonadales bacterium]
VVPAAIAFQFAHGKGALAILSWLAGVISSAGGLWLSFRYDLPTGPVVVCMFGLLLLIAYTARKFMGLERGAVAA